MNIYRLNQKNNYINIYHFDLLSFCMATWRNGYAEDCKSFHPGSIPGVASKKKCCVKQKKKVSSDFTFLGSSVGRAVDG